MKKTLLVSILLIPLMLIATQIAYGGGNPPNPPVWDTYGNYVGPDVTGTLILTLTYDSLLGYTTNMTFNGQCKNFPINAPFSIPGETTFYTATPEYLLGTPEWWTCNGCLPPQMLTFIPEGCIPSRDLLTPNAFVYKVMHYTWSGNTKTFDIVAKFLTVVPIKK